MSNFSFLQPEWPDLHDAAAKAEALPHTNARTACFHARRALELLVHLLYKFEAKLHRLYQEGQSVLDHRDFKGEF